MQMIGQQHPGIDSEWMAFAHTIDCRAHCLANVFIAEKGLPAIGDDREETGATRGVGSTIVRHQGMVAAWATSCPPYRATPAATPGLAPP